MNNANSLVNPQGQPLIQEPKLIVLKCEQPLNQQFVQQISKLTGCIVITLPMSVEMLKGSVAARSMALIHNNIHAVMDLPQIAFTKQELEVVQKALVYAIRSLHIDSNAQEGRIEQRIGEAIK